MLDFMKQFILHPGRTGAIIPSSKDLAKAMLESVDFSHATHIVELGPGTGTFTRLILECMRPDTRLTVIESNLVFCKNLEDIHDSRLTVINCDARDLSSIEKADYVVSSLPLNLFSKTDRIKILHEIKYITRDSYIQFHYLPFGEKYLKESFADITKRWVVKNIPPAVVYTARLPN